MFNFHRNRENLFQTRVIVEKKEELPPELKEPEPLPETRKEAKEQNKHRYLPGERLQMKLNQQARREKKQKKFDVDDVDLVPSCEDVRSHLRIPVTSTLAEVDAGFDEFFDD